MVELLFLLLPVAAACGWYAGYRHQRRSTSKSLASLRRDYFVGLNYLINEQPDKAVDVFVKLLEADSDTIDVHLALGSLFRRRGEVGRAIRIHQNLIARPQLTKEQRLHALAELGEDYMSAGVLDRAERLFLELAQIAENKVVSLRHLQDIYQRQKDWEQAMAVVRKLAAATSQNMNRVIAHYYCELAEQLLSQGKRDQAQQYLKRALSSDKLCVRASLLQGGLENDEGRYKTAIQCYQRIRNQDPEYISEIIAPLSSCYEQLSQEKELISYLKECLTQHPRISLILTLSEYLRKWQDDRAAINFIAEQIRFYPSLRAVGRLIELYLHNSSGDGRDKLLILQGLVEKLLADKPIYRCIHCGFAGKVLYWLCPGCKEWNTMRPIHGLEGD